MAVRARPDDEAGLGTLDERRGDRADELSDLAGPRTAEIIARRRAGGHLRGRGWLVRRALVGADLAGLTAAFCLAEGLLSGPSPLGARAWPVLGAILPAWVLVAHLSGLYDRDGERADHSTADDVTGVFHLVTAGVWLLLLAGRLTGAAEPTFLKLGGFWIMAILFVTIGRAVARTAARRSLLYLQNVVIVGAGDVGQLVARKMLQHPEYGINLVGFVDDHPREARPELSDVAQLGPTSGLTRIVETLDIDRVVVAFSNEPERKTVMLLRSLGGLDVQVDVVPRLFEVIGPHIINHSIETLPLIGLRRMRSSRSSRAVKRLVDIVGASVALVVSAPVFLVAAVLIRRDSAGPAIFRQTRLGLGMREFEALKFRTMRVGVDDTAHREYIRKTMSASASVGANGLYKLERPDDVTRVGRWLRRTSLDELPQLLNVLRGEMSLVGPRPCIPYETECFKAHHFERFMVPAGITGLWQVTARAHSTFGESLDMDVSYTRGWSLALDLRLLCLTPFRMLRLRGTV
jgi:exopolysaccharide biosynthesis polyprenyl glycosylphosphotransferase